MQLLVALPAWDENERRRNIEPSLFRKVCGIPLLARVVATACRSGGTEVLLLRPKTLPEAPLKTCLKSILPSAIPVHTLALDKPFDPDDPADWRTIESRLEAQFLWLPWGTVVEKKTLSRLLAEGKTSEEGVRLEWLGGTSREGQQGPGLSQGASPNLPAVVVKAKLKIAEDSAKDDTGTGGSLQQYLADSSLPRVSVPGPPGVLVRSRETARRAECELVRGSGKELDGIYSKFNRWLCRPAVRWLSKTPVTPNMVTFGGLLVSLLAAYSYAQGHWSAYVLGGLLYFIAVLFDEMDGMLARIRFRDSAFGCWLETFVDYASYIFLFVGITIGLYRESGVLWLWLGSLLMLGTVASFVVASRQRKLATARDKPQELVKQFYRRLEADSGNVVSRFTRQAHFLCKKGAICHYVLIFSVLGQLKALYLLMVLGANLVWTLGVYFNRLFWPSGKRATQRPEVAGGVAVAGRSGGDV